MDAIIPAAGLGTRFLPATRAVPKEMLPVGATPALDLIVSEARAAGARRIAIVVSDGKDCIRRYFADAPDVVFARQEEQRGLGHAVLQAASVLGREPDGPVAVLLGDALVSGCCALAEMTAAMRRLDACAAIGCERVPRERVSRYGIMKVRDGLIEDIVEKPSPEEAPGDLAVAGRYILPPELFAFLESQAPGKAGEIQLTDAIRRMLPGRRFAACEYPGGRRHDIGNPDGYYAALKAFRIAEGKEV